MSGINKGIAWMLAGRGRLGYPLQSMGLAALALLTVGVTATTAAPSTGDAFTITAKRLRIDNGKRIGTYEGDVRVLRGALTISCETLMATLDKFENVESMRAQGNVVMLEGDREAHGDVADYDRNAELLVAHGNPWIRFGMRTVHGEVIRWYRTTQRLEVLRPHTVAPVDASGTRQVTIDADALTLDTASSRATWRGHVKAVRGVTELTTPVLAAQWGASGELTHLSADGGVEAKEPSRRARGQHAEYDLVKGVLVVTGSPEAWQGKNRLRGSRVTLFPDTERVQVDDATSIIEVSEPPKKKKP